MSGSPEYHPQLLQNCGLPSILEGPGPFTVFVPSNEAVDSLRDGRLIYLFTAVSIMRKEGLALLGLLGTSSPPAAEPSLACQGLSKLQELVRYHIYNHGQVGSVWGWGVVRPVPLHPPQAPHRTGELSVESDLPSPWSWGGQLPLPSPSPVAIWTPP